LPQPVETTTNETIRKAERKRFTGHPHSCEKGITFGRIGCRFPIPPGSAELIFA
jgi:hypothetical protein